MVMLLFFIRYEGCYNQLINVIILVIDCESQENKNYCFFNYCIDNNQNVKFYENFFIVMRDGQIL